MIGFDVPYGNQTFIADGENGYLLPYSREEQDDVRVERLAEAILRLFTEADQDAFRRRSYEIAKEYLEEKVAVKWKELLDQMGSRSVEFMQN